MILHQEVGRRVEEIHENDWLGVLFLKKMLFADLFCRR